MIISHALRSILVLTFLISSTACADSNCTFSKESIDKSHYANNKLIASYEWFGDNTEIKGVLKNGNFFSVKHWACEHYGKQAVMIIGPQINSIPNLLNNHILELGKMSLNESELKILSNALKPKNISLSDAPVKNYIKADDYSEFYYQVSIASEIIFIEIKLYKS